MKGINIIGYLEDGIGLGESGRLIVSSLEANGIPVSKVSIRCKEPIPKKIPELHYPINLFCMDYSHTTAFLEQLGWKKLQKYYNIANIFWETNLFPKERIVHWNYLNEIWATTKYIQEHASIASRIPVYRIPQPIQLNFSPKDPAASKASFQIDQRFTFLFCFDFGSIFNRKNPLAIIAAFSKAFPHSKDVQLIFKTNHADLCQKHAKIFEDAIKTDSRIRWIDGLITAERRYELMNACDCYISLHRSEGLGLTMAEAMLLNKPVIATGYSGNLDFMNDANSFLCSYTLAPVGEGSPPYPSNGVWAEVDIDEAANLMKYVKERPDKAIEKVKAGREHILKYHSNEYVGRIISSHIEKIPLGKQKSRKMPLVYILRKCNLSAPSTLRHFLAQLKRKIKKMIGKSHD